MTNIKNFKVFMHVDRYYYAAHMYKKCLILGLLILISGNVINFTFQFYDGQRIFAQTNQSPEADDQKVSVDANDKIKIILEGKDDDKDDEIKFDIVSDPSHGKLDNFDKSDGTVTYSPEEDYSGDDEFKFKVVDDKGAESNTGDVEITVKSVTETNQQSATTGDETNQQSATTGDETNQQTTTTGDETNQQSATTGDETNQQTTTTGDETNQQTTTTGNETNQQTTTTGNETNQQTTTTGDETNMEAENQTTRQLLKNNESIANNQPPFAYDQDLSIHMNEKADISLTGKDDDNDPIQFAIVSDPTDASLDNFDTTKGTLTFVPKTDYI
ncbi:MAG: Ig-like domain-containing protein, partial [Nitrososphaeraceae archaeon]|nr:Ig-like domain-containing protein [Nitrososphaeraceae archaeon]